MTDTIVDALIRDRESLAIETTALMEKEHPDLFARYGPVGRIRCTEDTAFHVEHLAAALDIEDRQAFADYVRWLLGLLAARSVPADDVALNFRCLAAVVEARYGDAADPAIRLLSAPLPTEG